MAATGFLAQCVNQVVATITSAGLTAVTDPRNARPMTVLVRPPSADTFNNNITTVTIVLNVLGAPPSNLDSLDYLMTTAETLLTTDMAIIGPIEFGIVTIGSQELPTYTITVRLGNRRN